MSDTASASTSQAVEQNEQEESLVLSKIEDINTQVAQFRDLLIGIGQQRDCPELREKIRKLRQSCVQACKTTTQILLPEVRRTTDLGILLDSPNLIMLVHSVNLFLRELSKSKTLTRVVPMDMQGYYENRPGPSNIGNVMSQMLLCNQITQDFQDQELCSIVKDSKEIRDLIKELQEFMPNMSMDPERYSALKTAGPRPQGIIAGTSKARLNIVSTPSPARRQSHVCGTLKLLCCMTRSNYI